MGNRTRLLGLKALLHDAVDATVNLVRDGHESASRGLTAAGDAAGVGATVRKVEFVRMGATRGVLFTVSAVNRTVELVTDVAIDRAFPATEDASIDALPLRDDVAFSRQWWSDAIVGGLGGAVGSHLARRGNPLGTDMVLRIGDRYYVPKRCESRAFEDLEHVAVFVHGLGTTEWSWVFGAERAWGDPATCFGTLLESEDGISPIYVRYNTGRTIAENGAALAELLSELQKRAPGLRSLELFGHSMGGLVTREACRVGAAREDAWTDLVDHVFYLASPHHGAPLAGLARGAAGVLGAVDLPATRVISNIIDGRSDGIKDLADGLVDELPLPRARHTFISGTITSDPDHPVGWVLGDLLVRRPSAEGERISDHTIPVSREHQGLVPHHALQNHPAVFELIRRSRSGRDIVTDQKKSTGM